MVALQRVQGSVWRPSRWRFAGRGSRVMDGRAPSRPSVIVLAHVLVAGEWLPVDDAVVGVGAIGGRALPVSLGAHSEHFGVPEAVAAEGDLAAVGRPRGVPALLVGQSSLA